MPNSVGSSPQQQNKFKRREDIPSPVTVSAAASLGEKLVHKAGAENNSKSSVSAVKRKLHQSIKAAQTNKGTTPLQKPEDEIDNRSNYI